MKDFINNMILLKEHFHFAGKIYKNNKKNKEHPNYIEEFFRRIKSNELWNLIFSIEYPQQKGTEFEKDREVLAYFYSSLHYGYLAD